MNGNESTSQKVLDALVGSAVLTVEQLGKAVEAARAEGRHPGELLVERGMISQEDIASVLEEQMGVPRVDLTSYTPEEEALRLVPAALAREKRLLPLFEIEGMLTVAIGDPVDVFALDRVAEDLGIEVEAVLADSADLLASIAQYYGEAEIAAETEAAEEVHAEPAEEAEGEPEEPEPVAEEAGPGPEEPAEHEEREVPLEEEAPPVAPIAEEGFEEAEYVVPVAPEPEGVAADETAAEAIPAETLEAVAEAERVEGAAGVDLDVLAVADDKRVGVLVSDIVSAAVKAGASNIQVLPYKDDFFLVFRVKGKLEKIASAPLSLQGALVQGIKHFARLSQVPPTQPALGRVRARYENREWAITVSAVPTVAGQRVVMTLRPADIEPRSLVDLGMNEAEQKALHAMVERGRGLLLVCAPVAGGRSQTYYSLLAHASEVGKTAYSVERSVAYELPAVAQVMVSPGSTPGPAAYIAAGLRQDVDVVAVDSLQSTEDVHLAVEATGRGKLVIATFAAGGIAAGVRRILDLGVEPHSLAAALTLAVGQRLVRTNCPNCSEDVRSPLNKAIPGFKADAVTKTGTGCPNCRKTGFAGVTGIFEVLPFSETVRAAVASGAGLEELEKVMLASGMRPLLKNGVAKVESGSVSVEELARVLRLGD